MEERDDYIPEQKGNEKRITPFERFVPGIIPAHEIACQNQEKCHAAVENRKLEQAGEREGRRVDAYNQACREESGYVNPMFPDEGNKIVGFCGVMKESAFGAP